MIEKLFRAGAVFALAAALGLAAAPGSVATGAHAAARVVHVAGLTTTWDLSLLQIRSTYAFPRSWRGYSGSFFRFFVLTLHLANTGRRTASPSGDLMLTLKVRPPYTAPQVSGFTEVALNDRGMAPLARGAARLYGGVLPTVATQPGHGRIYSYLIATVRGQSHYGLYNAKVSPGDSGPSYTYLLDTGM